MMQNQTDDASVCQDNYLKLELTTSSDTYRSDEAIECKATLTYIGEEDGFKFYSGDPVVMFALEGGAFFHGEQDMLNVGVDRYEILRGEPIEYRFEKYVGSHLTADKEAVDFWANFLQEDELKLEPGRYKMFAKISYCLTLGGEISVRIRVQIK